MNRLEISRFPALDYAANEAINTLCTNLSYCGDDVRAILFTSRYEQEGKSSIVMNVMRTLASLGKRTVLVDADLRRSSLARRYRLQYSQRQNYGLAQYLAGMCPLEEVVYETNLPNAYLLPAGREVFSSLQLLASPRYGKMMRVLRENFDVVLVDTPPAGVIVDAIEIAKYCDGAVIVVAYNTGRKQEVGEVADNLRKTGCRVLGAVMNGVDLGAFRNRRYYYRSGRYSAYYDHGARYERAERKGDARTAKK